MIKECKVILHNSAVTVVEYDGNKVQLPSVQDCGKLVYVKINDGKYTVISKEEYDESLKNTTKKSKKVKEKVEENEEEIEPIDARNN